MGQTPGPRWATRGWATRGRALLATCRAIVLVSALAAMACSGGTDSAATAPITAGPAVATPIVTRSAVVGMPYSFDATQGGAAFSDPKGKGLSYAVSFSGTTDGLDAAGGLISGAATAPGVVSATVTATDAAGATASQAFAVVVFAAGLPSVTLPLPAFGYSDASAPLPAWFTGPGPGGSAIADDNTPATNPTTDVGAALGRVLFYDTRLSANDAVACASCHIQAFGFSDTARFSRGIAGVTTRHAMALGNARFYQRGHFFWDERAVALEDQPLQPIQNPVEMDETLDHLVLKLGVTSYYPPLFTAAFGTPEITSAKIAMALAQFVRSLVSANAKFDLAFAGGGAPNFGVLSSQEQQGQQLFAGAAGCAACHSTNAVVADDIHNTGLDATITDVGAGNGRFKAPSLRNVGARGPYMHDGRFQTLQQVVSFYDSGVQPNPDLDPRLLGPDSLPQLLHLSQAQRNAIVAFLNTLTDSSFLTAAKFASPFPKR
jgi:cytochrome c peroxidase